MAIEVGNTTCYKCGVEVWLRAERLAELRQNRQQFFCPNGHEQAFVVGKSAEARRAEAAEAELARVRRTLDEERAKRFRAQEDLTRERNRCGHCGKKCLSPERLKRHQREVHGLAPKALPENGGPSS